MGCTLWHSRVSCCLEQPQLCKSAGSSPSDSTFDLVLLGKQHMDGGPGAWTLPPTWETWVEVQAPGVSPVLSLAIAGIWGIDQWTEDCPLSFRSMKMIKHLKTKFLITFDDLAIPRYSLTWTFLCFHENTPNWQFPKHFWKKWGWATYNLPVILRKITTEFRKKVDMSPLNRPVWLV